MICEIGHHAGAFVGFTDAFKGLDGAQAAQFGKAVALGLVVQQVAAENFEQIRLCDKRRKRQENETAFRTIAAPVTPASLARLAECRVAASEDAKIFPVFRESPGDFDLRQWPQQREIADAR